MATRSVQRRFIRPYGGTVGRGEPFELITRTKTSRFVRVLGLIIRRRVEITAVIAGLVGWWWLTSHLPPLAALALLAVVAGGLVGYPPTRRFLARRWWAVLTRHRLRAVMSERRIMNYSGNLPLLLWSHPTAVGERVLVLLRAGVDVLDFEANLPYLASGCFARTARAQAWKRMTAFVLVDIVRRDPLTASDVTSDLTSAPPPRPPLRLVPPLDPATERGA